jgi:response regulator RpfG family c-di-GMP phosphodiesterase
MDSPRQGFEYIRDNPDTVLFVVVFVEEIGRGKAFLELVKQDELTDTIPVFFLNGFEDTGKLLLFEEGVNGLLQKPLNVSSLLMILNRLGYNSVISKN